MLELHVDYEKETVYYQFKSIDDNTALLEITDEQGCIVSKSELNTKQLLSKIEHLLDKGAY